MTDTRATFKPWLMLSIIVLIAVALRLPNLTESIWFDELWSTYYKLGSFRQLAYYAVYDVSPPFHYAFMFGWIRAFGDSELAIRIPALIFGILSIPLGYMIGATYFSKPTGLLTALMMSLSPVHIWYSQEARPYSMLIFAFLLAIFAVEKLRESNPARLWFGVYICAIGACLFSHYYLLFPLVALTALLFVRRHPEARRLVIANMIVSIPFAIYISIKIGMGALRSDLSYARPFTADEAYQLYFNWFLLGNALNSDQGAWLILLIQLVFAVLLIRGLYRAVFSDRGVESRAYEVALYCIVLPAGLWMLGLLGSRNYIERSAIVAMPFFFMIIAAGITATKGVILKGGLTLLLILANTTALFSYFRRSDEWTVYKQNADWRGAASFLREQQQPLSGPTFVLVFSPADELSYYDPEVRQTECDKPDETDGRALSEDRGSELVVVRMARGGCPGFADRLMQRGPAKFFAIRNEFWLGSFDEVMPQITGDARLKVEKLTDLKGLTIYEVSLHEGFEEK